MVTAKENRCLRDMQKTRIEWVRNQDGSQGYTWNPVTGCLHGCEYCYARKIAKRFIGHFKPEVHVERMNEPSKHKQSSTIFCGSMSDIFGDWIQDNVLLAITNQAFQCPQHTFLFLTKNPKRYAQISFPSNCWIGYSDDGTQDNHNWVYLQVHKNRFTSFEPLIGDRININFAFVDWLIIGALNRNGKPVPPQKGGTRKESVLAILEKADKNNIPIFIKNSLLELYPDIPRRQEIPY